MRWSCLASVVFWCRYELHRLFSGSVRQCPRSRNVVVLGSVRCGSIQPGGRNGVHTVSERRVRFDDTADVAGVQVRGPFRVQPQSFAKCSKCAGAIVTAVLLVSEQRPM